MATHATCPPRWRIATVAMFIYTKWVCLQWVYSLQDNEIHWSTYICNEIHWVSLSVMICTSDLRMLSMQHMAENGSL